jgi:hypothetical protein
MQDAGALDSALRLAHNALGLLGRTGRPGSVGPDQRRRVRRRYGVLAALDALARRSIEDMRKAAQKLRLAERVSTSAVILTLANIITSDPKALSTQRALRSLAADLAELAVEESALVQPTTEAVLEYVEELATGTKAVPQTRKGREDLAAALHILSQFAPTARSRFERAEQLILLELLRRLAGSSSSAAVNEFTCLRAGVEAHPDLARFDAWHTEANGEHADAARRWEALGQSDAAMRCVRRLNDLHAVERMAQRLDAQDSESISWGVALVDLLAKRPAEGMDPADEGLVRDAFEAVFPGKRGRKKR